MATLNYISGYDYCSATDMNRLFAELDSKLSKMFSGKSFLCGIYSNEFTANNNLNNLLVGKGFYFTGTSPSAYSITMPDSVVSASTGVWNYDHLTFGVIAAGKTGSATYSAVSRTATITDVAATSYPSFSVYVDTNSPGAANNFTSVFDFSLETHKINSGSTGQYYFIKENRIGTPEKWHDWAVAEVVMENMDEASPTTNLPETWDKYCFFRVHNMNAIQRDITFGSAYTLTLGPLECKTVRRDRITGSMFTCSFSNYRTGSNYFWNFEEGDPRSFWFLPTKRGYRLAYPGYQATVEKLNHHNPCNNSETANNIVNPAILYEWIYYWADENILNNGHLARLERDPSVAYNAYSHYTNLFGDPSNDDTPFGDVIHHKGSGLIYRIHRTQYAPPTFVYKRVQSRSFVFNGYDTIIQDFSNSMANWPTTESWNVSITETASLFNNGTYPAPNAGGTNYILSASVDNWTYDLIPLNTNLFKPQGIAAEASLYYQPSDIETHRLAILDLTNIRRIEREVLENTYNWGGATRWLSAAGKRLVYPRYEVTGSSQRTYSTSASISDTIIGGTTSSLLRRSHGTYANWKYMAGVGHETIGGLKNLEYWGVNGSGSQDTSYNTFVSRSVVLTPEGPLLTYTERVNKNIIPYGLISQDYTDFEVDSPDHEYTEHWNYPDENNPNDFWIKRGIRFPFNGWADSRVGYQYCNYYSPKYGRLICNPYHDNVNNTGSDQKVFMLNPVETSIKRLTRVLPDHLGLADNNADSRTNFWGKNWCIKSSSCLDAAFDVFQSLQRSFGDYQSTRGNYYFPAAYTTTLIATTNPTVAQPMLVEQYNNMVAVVNSINKVFPVSYRAWRWIHEGQQYVMLSDYDGYGGKVAWGGTLANTFDAVPAPSESFHKIDLTTETTNSYQSIGLSVKTFADITAIQAFLTQSNDFHTITLSGSSNYDNTFFVDYGLGAFDGVFYSDITVEQSYEIGPTWTSSALVGRAYMPRELSQPVRNWPYGAGTTNIDLNTSYASVYYITIADVKALCDDLQIPWLFKEVVVPMELKKITKPKTPTELFYTASATYYSSPIRITWTAMPGAGWIAYLDSLHDTANLVNTRSVAQICFDYPNPDVNSVSSAPFKSYPFALGGTLPLANSHFRRNRNSGSYPEWYTFIMTSNAYTWPSDRFPPSDPLRAFLHFVTPYINADDVWHNLINYTGNITGSTYGKVKGAIEFTPADDGEEDQYNQWAKWALYENQYFVMNMATSSFYGSNVGSIYTIPEATYGQEIDWWKNGDLYRLLYALENQWNYSSGKPGGDSGKAPYIAVQSGSHIKAAVKNGINFLSSSNNITDYPNGSYATHFYDYRQASVVV